MNKKWKGQVKTGVFLIIMLTLYASCTVSFYKLQTNSHTATISYGTSGGLDETGYKALKEQEEKEENPLDFCMWTEEEGVLLRNEQIGRSVQVTVMKARGALSVMLPFPTSLQEDDSGCYLDQTAAMELFGNLDIVGCDLEYPFGNLTVRGVTEDYGGLLLMYPEHQEELERITVKLQKGVSTRNQVREFTSRHGLAGGVLFHTLPRETAQIFPVLLPAGIMFLCLAEGRKRCRNAADVREKSAGYGLVTAAFIFIAAVLILFVDIPRDLIPGKWSDFTFFGIWKENFYKDVISYIRYPKGLTEVPYVVLFIKTALTGFGSVMMLCLTVRSYMSSKNVQ